MTFAEYVVSMEEALSTNRWERPGQLYFNVLHTLRPALADRVRGTDLDPFYLSKRLPAFLAFVEENWGVPDV